MLRTDDIHGSAVIFFATVAKMQQLIAVGAHSLFVVIAENEFKFELKTTLGTGAYCLTPTFIIELILLD